MPFPDAPADVPRRTAMSALLGLGFVTDFLDTLGIGSFAVTTVVLVQGRLVDDGDIPGTLTSGTRFRPCPRRSSTSSCSAV